MGLRVHLLGPVEIRRDEESIEIPGFKPAALLAYLLITEKSQTRQHLVDFLYDDSSDPRASLRWTLSHLRKAIGLEYILADRQQIRFNFDSDHWFDVSELLSGNADLYRGELLQGLYLRDAPQFMEWLLFEREHIRLTYQSTLQQQLTTSRQKNACAETAVIAQKLLLLDNLREDWHQALIEAYVQLGQRKAALAQFNLCKRLLNDELDLKPAAATAALVEVLKTGTHSGSTPFINPASLVIPPITEEAILTHSPFVSREQELSQLHSWLDKAVSGQGKVVFVTGTAGQGKTALLHAFARQAMNKHPSLLVAIGQGNAYAGIGDPYLPFQDVMAMLIGTSKAGFLSADHVTRLQSAKIKILEHILEHGADLANIFVPVSVLETRLTAVFGKRNEARYIQHTTSDLPQTAVFQQLTNVLKALTAQQPILLLLDDLQWVDPSSISLLFHLGRRISSSRILIVGAYRPEEVAMGVNGRRHPLQSVLAEFKRLFGHIWIPLGESLDEENRHFVNAYLDEEPNQLDEDFRQALFQHTGGHPLFTVELMQSLQERGALIKNDASEWIVGRSLNWDRLPARVEAVISERIERLETELRELLQVASIEGTTFTTQVLAQVQAMTERQLLRQLSQALNQQHRLVQEQGEIKVNQQFIYQYRFAHTLFQRYLYHKISLPERRLLHREVGQMLETVYGNDTPKIAGQLARHFEEANLPQRAIHYLRLAGEQAEQKYAHDEAIAYFSHALDLMPVDDFQNRFEIIQAREKIWETKSDRTAQLEDLERLETIVAALEPDKCIHEKIELLLRQAHYLNITSEFGKANASAQAVLTLLAHAKNPVQEAAAYLIWGLGLFRLADFESAQVQLTKAYHIAKDAKLYDIQANSLRRLGLVALNQGQYEKAETFFSQGIELSRKVNDRLGEGDFLNDLGISLKDQRHYDKAIEIYEEALQLFQKMGNPHREAQVLNNLGDLMRHLGQFEKATTFLKQALQLCHEMNERYGESIVLNNLGLIAHNRGHHQLALDENIQAIQITRELGNLRVQGLILRVIGYALTGLGHFSEAADHLQEAVALVDELGQAHLAAEARSGLAMTYLADGKLIEARSQIEIVLLYLEHGNLTGTEEPYRVYWHCYEVLQANQDRRAEAILDTAYHSLQAQAANIVDDALRCSMLENVPFHRDIIHAYKKAQLGQ